ncbi:bifunctional peptidase and arginyl-hydroxylase JMJD5-like [Haliotis rufescens]|uniref:bifunctional peptidase and arginyl-hydroxylase JMJD5-like n=1 Tax=Haliotis rufescens TaxID=6454 RepID=UPI00201EABF3|nr:bifunctional peptidase and arginyl-hydroxylase JMJD5-like [Haliotis rufescens]
MVYVSASTLTVSCVVTTMVCATLMTFCATEGVQFQGHLKPLGSYHPLHDIPVMEGIPTPQYFYEWFVRPGQPVLLRSALNNPSFKYPAYKLWNDDYLSRRFGDLVVTFEHHKKETRKDTDGAMGLFRTFLNQYNTSDVYLVMNVAQISGMAEDIFLPPFVTCGGTQKLMTLYNLWFSSGGTKSVLHSDSMDNINCLMDGTKDFIFIDKRYKPQIEASGFNSERGFSTVDVDRVDLVKFPEFKSIPWLKAEMKKGDCLFIPANWYHQVYSHQGRNLASNVWFEHPLWFNTTDCERTTQLPLNEAPPITPQNFLRLNLFSELEGKDRIYQDNLHYMVKDVQYAKQVYDYFNTDGDDHVTWEELYQADVYDFTTRFKDMLRDTAETIMRGYPYDLIDGENKDQSQAKEEL